MSASDPPTLATGKICYLVIPAVDIDRSADFYGRAFGWRIRRRDDGSTAFDDTVNEVSGTWTLDVPPASDPGLMIYIMVADAAAAVESVLAAGGEIVQGLDDAAQETLATFRDPAGNLLGIYQQPGLAEAEAGARAESESEVEVEVRGGTPSPIPEHVHTVTPRLVVSDGAGAIDFYRAAFGAEELGERFTGPDGELIHAEVRIGDSVVAITEAAADAAPAPAADSIFSAIMSTYWEDVDTAWERALAAGAEVIYPLANHFYGERGGRLRDPYRQQWMLSQRIEDLSHAEIVRRAQAGMSGD
jgi:uncharacterized glyoxalase superfamily protein PhnB